MSLDMQVPVEQVLADIDDRIATLAATAAALRELYGLPEALEVPPPSPRASAPPAAVDTPAPKRRAPRPAAGEADPPAPIRLDSRTGSKHDAGILRVLRSEQAAHGLGLMDLCRAMVGPGKPDAARDINGGVHMALASLIKRGEVRKDGRHYYIVRAHEQGGRMKVLAEAAGVELVRVPRRALTTDTPFVVREQADHAVLLASSSLRLAREQFDHEVFVRQLGVAASIPKVLTTEDHR